MLESIIMTETSEESMAIASKTTRPRSATTKKAESAPETELAATEPEPEPEPEAEVETPEDAANTDLGTSTETTEDDADSEAAPVVKPKEPFAYEYLFTKKPKDPDAPPTEPISNYPPPKDGVIITDIGTNNLPGVGSGSKLLITKNVYKKVAVPGSRDRFHYVLLFGKGMLVDKSKLVS